MQVRPVQQWCSSLTTYISSWSCWCFYCTQDVVFFPVNSLSLWGRLIKLFPLCVVFWSNILVNVVRLTNTHNAKWSRCNKKQGCSRCPLEVDALHRLFFFWVNSVHSKHGVFMFRIRPRPWLCCNLTARKNQFCQRRCLDNLLCLKQKYQIIIIFI